MSCRRGRTDPVQSPESTQGAGMKLFSKFLSAIMLIAVLACIGYAQGGVSSSLIGTVVDQSGGVIPGADVLVKNDATGADFKAITNESGMFSIPSLNPGIYTASVTMPSFKKAEVKNITLVAGTPSSI